MDDQDQKLENIMRSRGDIPAMRSNLSARIIDAAKTTPQEKTNVLFRLSSVGDMLGSFGNNIMAPRPAMVMGLVLALGVAFGVFMQDMTEVPEEDLIFLYVENSFLFEDWL